MISALQNPDLEKPLRLLAECEAARAIVLEKKASLEKEIADAPDWRSYTDGRERQRECTRQEQLRRSLERLAEGTLMISPGIYAEALVHIDHRITALHQRIADAQARIDAHVKQAEALLGETVMR